MLFCFGTGHRLKTYFMRSNLMPHLLCIENTFYESNQITSYFHLSFETNDLRLTGNLLVSPRNLLQIYLILDDYSSA